MSKFDINGYQLHFTFNNEQAAEHFKLWLCNRGEQDYWMWMERCELDEEGPITGIEFDYWNGSEVIVICGRLDSEEENSQ